LKEKKIERYKWFKLHFFLYAKTRFEV